MRSAVRAIPPITPPAIAPAFELFAALVVSVLLEPPAVPPAAAWAVEVTVTVLAVVTGVGVRVVVTVVVNGPSGGTTRMRSRKVVPSSPVLVISKVWFARGSAGERKKTWLYWVVRVGEPAKATAVPPSME